MQINSAEFRAICFKILDQVATTHREVIITKRGKPIAKIVPIDATDAEDVMIGALLGVGKTMHDLTQPLASKNDWEVD